MALRRPERDADRVEPDSHRVENDLLQTELSLISMLFRAGIPVPEGLTTAHHAMFLGYWSLGVTFLKPTLRWPRPPRWNSFQEDNHSYGAASFWLRVCLRPNCAG